MLRGIAKKLNRGIKALPRAFSEAAARGESQPQKDYTIGQDYGKFKLLSKDYFPDYEFTLLKFKHQELGTVHYHIATSDTNNCFSVTFKTVPDDNTGKMHILEHLALCGSQKYPVRDPFFNMIKRSLNTYMNAWTGPDFTSYPFSTVNRKDFYNLLSVYGESVFKPLLRKTDFMQEGWRLELQNPEDLNSPVLLKGVVYNEMKGVYENPDNIFMESVQSLLLGGTPYGHDAGGKPFEIPELTHEELVAYHKRNYHPSNATIFTYGDLPPEDHQQYLQEHFLAEFKNQTFNPPNLIPRSSGPIRKVLKVPPSPVQISPEKDSTVSVSFRCNVLGENIEDVIGLNVLTHLLFENPKSPFYVDFLETELADGYSPSYGYEGNVLPSFFTIGFKNVARGSSAELEQKIFETLERVAEEGFNPEMIESAVHQIELQSKVAKSNFGLQIFQSYLAAINHNVDSLIKQGLNIQQVLEHIRVNAEKGYFQQLVKKYFLQNQDRLYLTLETDEKYLDGINAQERELIQNLEKGLDLKAREQINKDAAQLKAEQEAVQQVDILPTLSVQDIAPQGETTLFHKETVEQIPVFFFHKPTNGVTHIRVKIDLHGLDHSTVHQLNILSILLDKIGTENHEYDEFHEIMQLYTSGLSLNLYYDGHYKDHQKINGFAVLSISAIDRNIEKMFELLTELLVKPDFKDHKHLLNTLRLESSSAATSLLERPLEFAVDYGISSNRPAQQFFNKLENVRNCNLEPLSHQFRQEPTAIGLSQQGFPRRPRDDLRLHFQQGDQAQEPGVLSALCKLEQ